MIKEKNIYDKLITLMIALLVFGNIGGALQPIRIFVIICIPFVMKYFMVRPLIRQHYRYESLFFVFWWIWAVVSLIWAIKPNESIKEILYLTVNFFILFVVIWLANNAQNPQKSIIRGWIFLFLLTVPIALCELLFDVHLSLSFHDSDVMMNYGTFVFERRYASVTFGNLNGYNTILCYIIPFIIINFYKTSSKGNFIYYIVLTTLISVIIIWNGSRSAILILGIVLLLFYFYYSKKSKSIFILFLILTAVSGYLIFVYFGDIFGVIFTRFQEQGLEDVGRLENIECGIDALLNSSLLGVGVGNYAPVMEQEYRLGIINPHNMMLEIVVQYGILILTGFLIFVFRILKKAKQNEDTSNKTMVVIALCIFPLAMIIDSSHLLNPSVWLFFASLYIIADQYYNRSYTC